MLITHDHEDHNYTKGIRGNFTVIRKPGLYDVKGVTVKAVQTIHGAGMGHNLVFVVEAEGLRIAHLGDIGNISGREIAAKAGGRIDVLMIPVDGIYTLTLEEADRMVGDLKPSFILPMHFKTKKAGRSLAGVDQFTEGKEYVKKIPQSEMEVTRKNLPDHSEIVLLQFDK